MKGERIRYQQTGEFHFLTFSCYCRRPYLSTVAAMELFEDALERVRLRYFFAVAGYVVMPEHVHLLVNEPRLGLLSRSVQALKLSVSMRSRERPFWQAHYHDFNVSEHEKYVEKLRRVAPVPVEFPNHAEGAPVPVLSLSKDPSQLGTGESTNLNPRAFCRSFLASCYTETGLSCRRGWFAIRRGTPPPPPIYFQNLQVII
jgi:putative transposase